MMQQFFSSFIQAIENLRNNFLHTLLSILGIVIGVAALVSILSLIDGMEKYARDQISSTTSLKNITIRTITHKTINNLQVRKDSFATIPYEDIDDLQQKISGQGKVYLISQKNDELKLSMEGTSFGALIIGIGPQIPSNETLILGRDFEKQDMESKREVAIINEQLAALISPKMSFEHLLGTTVLYNHHTFKIIGVLKKTAIPSPTFIIPITITDPNQFKLSPPICNIEANKVEEVAALKVKAQAWLNDRFKESKTDFECITNEFRVEQVRKGFLLFRIVMGLIVGISVVVGGIGIMNVLLISITERTMEIGIRKAIGAKRKDIMKLFISESLTLSVLGSILGIGLGVLITVIAIPIIKSFTKAPFQAAFTLNTIVIIAIISILIGIVFGTYPARKAANLDPVVAIQRN
ncbi:MAG: ABC transporter permease [Saprospiraceae bacterium]